MAITISLVLMLAGFALVLFGRKRRGLILFCLGVASCFVFETGLVPALMLAELQRDPFLTSPQWKSKNVIVVLGAGTQRWERQSEVVATPTWARARLLEAGRLYVLCKQTSAGCTVLTSGGDPAHNGISEAQVMMNELVALGIPADAIAREDQSRNTFQNAKYSAPLLVAGGYDNVILVTSGFHMRRAQAFFEFFGAKATAAPADRLQAMNVPLPVSFNFVYSDLAFHELFGLLQFQLYNLLGWNS